MTTFKVVNKPVLFADASPGYYQGVHRLSPVHAHGHRTPSPMDYHPNSVSPNYQFAAPGAYQPAHTSPLGACQVSPHHLHQSYDYKPLAAPHHLYLPPASIVDPSLQNGNCNPRYLDISGNTLGHAISAEPMLNLNINSKELELTDPVQAFNLSAELANLSCEAKKATQSQENMSQSLTNIVDDAYDQAMGNGHTNF